MKLCCLLALLVTGALGLGVRAEVRAEVRSEARAEVEPPAPDELASRAPSIDLAAALELLPPAIRSPQSHIGELTWRHTDDANGPRLVEQVPASSDGDAWFEVEYTVDPALDERVRKILERGNVAFGHVILLDPGSGEVFSYVSTDPENFPATRTYPTASLMKVVTASAILHDAPEAAAADCRYVGSPYRVRLAQLSAPSRGGRINSFEHALAISNNQCFARLAVDHVGEQRLLGEMKRVGLLEAPGFHHPAGRLEPIESRLDLGYLGSGLAGSFISPLGAARLAAMLARGELVTPFWIARVRDELGNSLAVPERHEPRPVWSPEVADQLRKLMLSVTSVGTARRAFHDRRGQPLLGEVEVSGKTGTLTGTNPDGLYQWFIGVAPADDPQVAIAAIVVAGKYRASSATDIAAATLREIFCDGDVCKAAKSNWLAARVENRRAIEAEEAAVIAAVEAAAGEREEELARMFEAHELDQMPRPIGSPSIELPLRLRRSKTKGKIVLMLELDSSGTISNAQIHSSDLPRRFNRFVLNEVKNWKFTPPTQGGRPVQARTRLPIPISVN